MCSKKAITTTTTTTTTWKYKKKTRPKGCLDTIYNYIYIRIKNLVIIDVVIGIDESSYFPILFVLVKNSKLVIECHQNIFSQPNNYIMRQHSRALKESC